MKRQMVPPHIVTLNDHALAAQGRLPAPIWAYFHGGAGDERTLNANIDAWQQLALRPRVLNRLQALNTEICYWGQRFPLPLAIAPMACQALAHEDGERAVAFAASALGVGFVLSQQASASLPEVAGLALGSRDRGPLLLQLYALHDRPHTLALIEQAQALGFDAVMVTVDAPLQGVRDRERQAGFVLPAGFPQPLMPKASPDSKGGSDVDSLAACLQRAPQWSDIQWLQQNTELPVLLKGITHPDDADRACQIGVSGIVVSNHGGRVLDGVPPTAHLLSAVVARVQARCLVFVDGGVRRGSDIFKALALGADGVLLGRPVLDGLANAGAAGVAHVLKLLIDEFHATMGLMGVDRLEAINPSSVGLIEGSKA